MEMVDGSGSTSSCCCPCRRGRKSIRESERAEDAPAELPSSRMSQRVSEDYGCRTSLIWTRYAGVVFLLFYLYNALEFFINSFAPKASESFTSLRLMLLNGRGIDIVQVLGLHVYRFYDPHAAAAAFLPQAALLLLIALFQAFADGGYAVEVSPWLISLEQHSMNLWVYVCRTTPGELPMLVALTFFMILTHAAQGETPAFLIAYALVWAKLVCFKLEVGQPRTWQLLQALAQLGFVLVTLLYLVAPPYGNNNPVVEVMFKTFPEVKQKQYLRMVFPHLALALCAYMERLRIAKVAVLKLQFRMRADTLESIDTISSDYARSGTFWTVQKGRCLRSFMKYKALIVAKLRKWTDELICICVLALSFGAALVPGTDVHSLALLLGTGHLSQ